MLRIHKEIEKERAFAEKIDKLTSNQIGKLSLIGESLTWDKIEKLAEILKKNVSLHTLIICDDALDEMDIKKLVNALKLHPALMSVRFDSCQIKNESVPYLADLFKNNHHIKSVSLKNNALTHEGLEKLITVASEDETIVYFNLHDNSGAFDLIEELDQKLVKRRYEFTGKINDLSRLLEFHLEELNWNNFKQTMAEIEQQIEKMKILSIIYSNFDPVLIPFIQKFEHYFTLIDKKFNFDWQNQNTFDVNRKAFEFLNELFEDTLFKTNQNLAQFDKNSTQVDNNDFMDVLAIRLFYKMGTFALYAEKNFYFALRFLAMLARSFGANNKFNELKNSLQYQDELIKTHAATLLHLAYCFSQIISSMINDNISIIEPNEKNSILFTLVTDINDRIADEVSTDELIYLAMDIFIRPARKMLEGQSDNQELFIYSYNIENQMVSLRATQTLKDYEKVTKNYSEQANNNDNDKEIKKENWCRFHRPKIDSMFASTPARDQYYRAQFD